VQRGAKVASAPGTFDEKECNGNSIGANSALPRCWDRLENVPTQVSLAVAVRGDGELSRYHAGLKMTIEAGGSEVQT